MKPILRKSLALLLFANSIVIAQVPTANFSISPNPVCSGTNNVVQITDNSSNSPTSWSYTVLSGGPGPGGGAPTLLSSQNPTISFNFAGTYTVTLVSTNSSGSSAPVSYTLSVLPAPNANINPANLTTCIGSNPLTLSVTAGGGPGGGGTNTYSWSTGSTASLISVTPSVTTSYSCLITGTNGCSVTRVATVTIATPTVSISSNPVNICPGTSSTLTATGTAPGPFTYTWSTALSTRTISTALAGVYDVTVTNSNGCTAVQSYTLGTSTTLSLTAVSNPSVLCAGNTATVRVVGAGTYTWSNGASTANTTVNPTSTTTYTVQGQIGVCSGTTAITLSVNVTPTILVSSTSPSLCAGSSATLNASGASTYTWLPSTTAQSLVINPTSSSSYTVRGNNPGCPNRTATISILVLPNPTITLVSSASVVCAGEAVAIGASGANTYSWSNGSTNALQLLNPTVTTTYTVVGFDQNSCKTTASIVQNVKDCTSLSENSVAENLFEVFPNPASDLVTIYSNADLKLVIYDQTGKVVKQCILNSGNNYTLQLTDLAKGIYYIKAQNNETNISKKLLIL